MSTNAAKSDSVRQVDLFIGGQWLPSSSGKYFDDRNPEDDSVFARAAHGTVEDIDRAVQCAHETFASYRLTLASQRENWLIKAAEQLEKDQDEFIEIIIAESGSPYNKAAFEINMALSCLRAAAGAARRATGQTIPSEIPGRFSMSVRSPLGVVGCITPFNVPLIKAIKLSAVALATGNTIVLLASEEGPVLATRVAQLYQDAGFPDGAFNVITGFGHEIGDSLTSHPLVKLLNFTGSSRVGKHIAELAGKQMKRIILELGGKNPLIVLADADLAQAVQGATIGMFMYQGQACMASSRIFVERPIFDEFVAQYKAAAESLGMGDLHDPTTILGPIISDRQRDRVRSHIEDAIAKGATLVTGGNWTGNRCHPTIFTDVKAGMTCFKEETFGPVTAVYPVDSAEEALELANDTVYGLSAAVYTSDINKALMLAQGIEAGMVHINAPTLHDEPNVPFGGVGESGFGREGTEVDIDTTTEWKWITIQLPGADLGH